MVDLARIIAGALKSAKRPLVISGFSCRSESVIQSAANVAKALCDGGRPAALSLIAPECNSVGLALMGARPLSQAFALASSGQVEIGALIVLENDLYRRMPAKQADKLLESAEHLVVLDHLANQTTAKAELLLPAGTFANPTAR
jgi:NADH-quinone oxidoreductase subunit G